MNNHRYSSLRRNAIGLKENMFQGVAGSAPAGAAVATLTGAAAYALGSLPLAAFIAFLVVFLNAFIISRLSTRIAGAGGYYYYVRNGLGSRPARFTGFLYIFYQIMALAFISLSVGVFVPAVLGSVFGISMPGYLMYVLIVVVLAAGFLISYSGVRESTRYTMYMAIAEMAIVAGMGVIILMMKPSINTLSVFTPKFAYGGLSGVGIGVLLMYTAFSGFGASTPLGEESREAEKTISRSVIFTVIVLGAFFVFSSYYFTVAWGPSNMASYASPNNLAPGITIISSYLGTGAAILITVLFINSLLTGTVVVTNSTSRVMMAMARDGIISENFSGVSSRKTPHISAAFVSGMAAVIAIVSASVIGGFGAFIMTATAATLGVLLVHGLINVSLPASDMRLHRSFYGSALLSVVSIAVLGFIFYSTFMSISLPVIVGSAAFALFSVAALAISIKNMSHEIPSEIPAES
ncbi:APC family permease [Thermoplasma sp.]|uniref:APC family permease n=1 Tax=Thermoplasma sp. TaxID=1973142 RepID=UPI00127081EC|nr:APC family permease [Thermoplasma sp.]KAA8922641.1 MAG: APC family permease [Thermoplasma sp.]